MSLLEIIHQNSTSATDVDSISHFWVLFHRGECKPHCLSKIAVFEETFHVQLLDIHSFEEVVSVIEWRKRFGYEICGVATRKAILENRHLPFGWSIERSGIYQHRCLKSLRRGLSEWKRNRARITRPNTRATSVLPMRFDQCLVNYVSWPRD